VLVYRRAPDDSWPRYPERHGPGASFTVPTLGAPLAADDIYAGILDGDGR
jgi:hypothetical protein